MPPGKRRNACGVDLRADVLKVGHHDSAYGTTLEFLRAVAPRDATISVGRHNLFGHPAATTLRGLQDSGASAYRTDHDGAVTVESDGKTFSVKGYLLRDSGIVIR